MLTMNQLIFATNNKNKVSEIRHLLPDQFEILSLADAGIVIDIPEPYDTLEKNAVEKASVIYNWKAMNCFAEDTGLEVMALDGAPGVNSARYAGGERSFEKNIDKLLDQLQNVENRDARFRTVICLMVNGQHRLFEGECKGRITTQRRGTGGFGYDAIFIPDGASRTFGEMNLEEKNIYSHRQKATAKLIGHLKEQGWLENRR